MSLWKYCAFCNNMNEASADYDDVVGRREELKDFVQTVARKKKSKCYTCWRKRCW